MPGAWIQDALVSYPQKKVLSHLHYNQLPNLVKAKDRRAVTVGIDEDGLDVGEVRIEIGITAGNDRQSGRIA